MGRFREQMREYYYDPSKYDTYLEQLGIEDRDEMFLSLEATWRGTRRAFQVIFGNVRELTTESLAAKSDSRKAILDFPFDDAGQG